MEQFFMACFECTHLYYQFCFNFYPALYKSKQSTSTKIRNSFRDKKKLVYYSMNQNALDLLADHVKYFKLEDEYLRFNYSCNFQHLSDYNGIKWIKKIKKSSENGYVYYFFIFFLFF